jgi:acyl-CoA synthetase (AMP-forming)/AMP-acid ligase II
MIDENPLGQVLAENFRRFADRRAIWHDGQWLSYHEVSTLVTLQARRLRRHLHSGDIVAAPGSGFDFVLTYLTAISLGSPVNCFPRADGCADRMTLPGVEGGLIWNESRPRSERGAFRVICLTSGTGGAPKRVVFDGESIAWGVWNTASLASEAAGRPVCEPSDVIEAIFNVEPLDLVFGVGMPLRSIAGLAVVNRALLCGEAIVIPEALDASSVWKAIVQAEATNAGIPPSTAGELLRVLRSSLSRSSLLALGIGGASVSPELAATLEERIECPVMSSYGATEVGGAALMPRPWDSQRTRWTTVGRPIGAVVTDLRPDSDGRGELLWIRSPAAMSGVLESSGTFEAHTDPWVCTGDLASMDGDGNVKIHGRADFVIQRGGRRIDPSTIEFALEADDSISRAGVCGVPSRVPGEQDIVAAVVPRTPHVDPFEIRRASQTRLPVHLVPRRVLVVDELPLATDGNLARGRLADLIAELTVGQREAD